MTTDKPAPTGAKISTTYSVGNVVVHQGKPYRVAGLMHCHVTGKTTWLIHPTDVKTAVRQSDCLWCDESAIQTIAQAKAALDAAGL